MQPEVIRRNGIGWKDIPNLPSLGIIIILFLVIRSGVALSNDLEAKTRPKATKARKIVYTIEEKLWEGPNRCWFSSDPGCREREHTIKYTTVIYPDEDYLELDSHEHKDKHKHHRSHRRP